MRKEKVHSRSVTYGVPASEDCENASEIQGASSLVLNFAKLRTVTSPLNTLERLRDAYGSDTTKIEKNDAGTIK